MAITNLFFVITILARFAASQNGCNYNFQFNRVGQTALLQSPNYPGEYPPNAECRYNFASPAGTQLTIKCNDFNLESSLNCEFDIFFLSLTGDTTFSDQQFFCGEGVLTRTTSANKLAIGFHSDSANPLSSKAFRFQCQISVINNTPPPPPACSCGQRNDGIRTRIVGGTAASVGEFPWRCALYSQDLGVFCGCTIISNNWVLTAAHCTNAVQAGDQIYVDVGDTDISVTTEAVNQLIPVGNIVQNSLYNFETQDSDISLLRLTIPLVFSRNIAPVCLPWNFVNKEFNGEKVVASGWGTTFFGGEQSSQLRKVDLPVLGTSQCAQFYKQPGSKITVNDNKICTYLPGRDTCQGDSGGSIDYLNNGRYYAIGVTSQGVGCGSENHPGIYTKIGKFLNWIQSNTGETFCRA